MIRCVQEQGNRGYLCGDPIEEARKVSPSNLHAIVCRKLAVLITAGALADLRVPPGNSLERLSGNREVATFDSHQ
jgi:hypothetical protein